MSSEGDCRGVGDSDRCQRQKRTAVTNAEGVYSFDGLGAGRYSSRFAKGFAETTEADVRDQSWRATIGFDLLPKVTIEEQKVIVGAETAVNTEAANNANQTLITGKDLDALPDDPDEPGCRPASPAGPSVGPRGRPDFC